MDINKKQKGFMQIPILIAIIISVLIIGGYIGIKLYKNYRETRIEEEKTRILAESQRKALEEATTEIEKLKQTAEQANQKQTALEQKVNGEIAKSKDITIQATEISLYLTGIGQVECTGKEGTGSLWKNSTGYFVLTNDHVVEGEKNCTFNIQDSQSDTKHSGMWSLELADNSWNNLTDSSLLRLVTFSPAAEISAPISNLNYLISSMPKCSVSMKIGSPVVIIGYPAYAKKTVEYDGGSGTQSFRTVTNGIISSQDKSTYFQNLPYSNYFISAKIDSGNSGGIAFSKDEKGLCLLGVPTWLSLGNYETQGIVQNIHNIIYEN